MYDLFDRDYCDRLEARLFELRESLRYLNAFSKEVNQPGFQLPADKAERRDAIEAARLHETLEELKEDLDKSIDKLKKADEVVTALLKMEPDDDNEDDDE